MGNSRKIKIAPLVAFVLAAQPALAICADDKVTIKGDFGQATFSVDIADDPQERAQGLMFLESMPTLQGMLFIYERPQSVSFWMKNTLLPLDMIFVSPQGEVLGIHQNAIPGDLTPISGGDGVQVVLEVNGGLTDRLGIAVGDVMQHPFFAGDALLPCVQKSDG